MQIRLINKIWENGRMINSPYSYMRLIPKDGLHPTHKKLLNRNHREIYQSRRFYLDEYPQQELLREEYFLSRILSIEWFLSDGQKLTTSTITINDAVSYYFDVTYEEEQDNYFYNRWLKKN